jgi:large repetitive protein
MRAVRCLLPLLALASGLFAQTPVGGVIQVNARPQAISGFSLSAVDPQGGFVVAWSRLDPGGRTASLFARRFLADGRPATGEIKIATTTLGVVPGAVVHADGSFLVLFATAGSDLKARVYGPDGTPQGDPAVLIPDFQGPELQVAQRADGGFVVLWEGIGGGNSLRVRSFAPDLAPLGPESLLAGAIFGVDAVATGPAGDFVVAWTTGAPSPVPDLTLYHVTAQAFAADGAPLSPPFLVSPQAYDGVGILRADKNDDGSFLVEWGAPTGLALVRRFSANGQPLGGILSLSAPAGGLATLENGDFVLAWAGRRGLLVRRFAAGGSPLGPAVRIDGVGNFALEHDPTGGFVLVWPGGRDFSVRLFR